MDAIKLFHGEVSEDLLMKEKQFEGSEDEAAEGRSRLLRPAGRPSEGPDRPRVPPALGKAYVELAELTARSATRPGAWRAPQGPGGASGAGVRAGSRYRDKLEVARGLNAAGVLQQSTGDMAGALESFEQARSLAEKAETQATRPNRLGRCWQRLTRYGPCAGRDGRPGRGTCGLRKGACNRADARRSQPGRRKGFERNGCHITQHRDASGVTRPNR